MLVFIGIIAIGAIANIVHPLGQTAGPGSEGTPQAAIPPFTFDPSTLAQQTAALAHVVKNMDKVEDQTFYYDPTAPRSDAENAFYPYIGKGQGSVWLRLVARYAGDDWIFFNRITIKADEVRFDITPTGTVREAHYGSVSEELDVPVGQKEISLLDFIKGAKDVTVRFSGPTYHHDKKLSAREKQAIQNVFLAYQALGGKPPP